MPIQSGDIKLVASQVMLDTPEGGGAPTSTVILDGASNAVFPDISELDRAGGRVNLRKLHVSVQTDDTDTYLGSNIIVAEPPQDPNVSVTLFSTKETFDKRDDASGRVESYLTRGPVWPAALFENHVTGQRTIQLFQRPGTAMPPIGRTLVLIYREGLPTERAQYVRVTKAESEVRMFYDINTDKDFSVMVTVCSLSDALRYDFPGTSPSKSFSIGSDKTLVRDTTVADAASYFGVEPLVAVAAIGDSGVRARSIYTQLVPSSRTEAIALDQKPAAQRLFTLATTPRNIEVGLTPHSMRVRVGQENRSFSWVQMLRPRPAPNTLVVSYRVQGSWYTVQDDGLGGFTGSGVGTVSYTTGSIALTLPALPDADSSLIFSWGESTAYTSRAGQAGFRAPEFAYEVSHQGLKPGSVKVRWKSGEVAKILTDDGAGNLTGDGTGQVNYAAGRVFVRPSAMIDAGGEFNTEYAYSTLITQNVAIPGLDAGGFATIPLDESPFPRSVTVKWITVRNVSETSGSSEITAKKTTGVETTTVLVPQSLYGITPSTTSLRAGGSVTFKLLLRGAPVGTYTYDIYTSGGVLASSFLNNSTTGTFAATGGSNEEVTGSFTLEVAPAAPSGTFWVTVYDPSLGKVATSRTVNITQFPSELTDIPANMPQPAIKVRNPISSGSQLQVGTGLTLVAGMYEGGRLSGRTIIYVAVFAMNSSQFGWYYDPPADPTQEWSQAELDAKSKTMQSLNGWSLSYPMWGGGTPISQNVSGG